MSSGDPFEAALVALSSAKVRFLVVGMFGVNFYARDPSQAFVTNDLDLLLAPEVSNLKTALGALSRAGFAFETGGEPFIDLDDDEALASVIRSGTTLRGSYDGQLVIDVMLSMTGFSHGELAGDAEPFRAHGVEILVAALPKLLESKRRAGRAKDLRFLEHYEAAMAEAPGKAPNKADKKAAKKAAPKAKRNAPKK